MRVRREARLGATPTRPRRRHGEALAIAIVVTVLALTWSCSVASATYAGFTDPQVVAVQGYIGSAMEPFITPDGRYLLFNTSNVEPNIPSLQFATRIDDETFAYQGPLLGEAVNEPGVLSGTPSLDRNGVLYFVSPRSYAQTLSTIYAGQFSEGEVTGVHLVTGVSGEAPGLVDFDAAVSPDGATLFVSVGDFSGGSGPSSASIRMYDKIAGGFVPDPNGSSMLKSVNAVAKLNYAAAISPDGLELFFTAASPAMGQAPAVYRAARSSTIAPFAQPERISAITGFTEAPSLSANGDTLYYHELVGDEFKIERVTRVVGPAPTVTKVSPRKGLASGGLSVRIKGSNLANVTAVRFGSEEATNVQVKSTREITATSPQAIGGTVDVIVTTTSGSSVPALVDQFKFVPTVTALSPNGGARVGGTDVTISGAGFALGASATIFKFGSKPALSVNCVSSTTCTVIAPAHTAGIVDVKATANAVTSARNAPADQFAYN
jgi:IPT/TIG domain/WD40-like Beta Propeller Repeat